MQFHLNGYRFLAISAGPDFKINPSISFMLNFDPSKLQDAEQQYGIVDIDTINVRPSPPRPKRNHPHTQRELNDAMPGFKVPPEMTRQEFLERLVWRGAKERYADVGRKQNGDPIRVSNGASAPQPAANGNTATSVPTDTALRRVRNERRSGSCGTREESFVVVLMQ